MPTTDATEIFSILDFSKCLIFLAFSKCLIFNDTSSEQKPGEYQRLLQIPSALYSTTNCHIRKSKRVARTTSFCLHDLDELMSNNARPN